MPCHWIKLPGGGVAHINMRGQRTKLCCICGRPHAKLCDYPLNGEKRGETCDRSLCVKCAVHKAPDTDYCPTHARMLEVAQ